jgi:D-amino peptidase
VPLVFVSGDVAVTREALGLNPNLVTVAVKEAVSRTAAKCIHPNKAGKLIREGVSEALKKRESIKPFTFNPPIEVRVKYMNSIMADAVEFMPSAVRVDGRTIDFVLDDYLKAFGAFRASIYIANTVSN